MTIPEFVFPPRELDNRIGLACPACLGRQLSYAGKLSGAGPAFKCAKCGAESIYYARMIPTEAACCHIVLRVSDDQIEIIELCQALRIAERTRNAIPSALWKIYCEIALSLPQCVHWHTDDDRRKTK